MKIALAFSGGGVRATVFHLGVLARLARQDLLGNVHVVSSVSGGSLTAGLVFTSAGYRWPTSEEYLHEIVPTPSVAIDDAKCPANLRVEISFVAVATCVGKSIGSG